MANTIYIVLNVTVATGETPDFPTVNGAQFGVTTKIADNVNGQDTWQRIYQLEAGEQDIADVISVNGLTGAVVLTADQIADGASKVLMTATERLRLSQMQDGAQVNRSAAQEVALLDGFFGSTDWQSDGGGSGVSDHGALTGLQDDDHPQYLNQSRGDARYNTQAQVTGFLAGKSNTGHPHVTADVAGLDAALAGKAAASHDHDAAAIVTGIIAPARLGSGSPSGTNFLRGDGSFAQIAYSQLTGVPSAFAPSPHTHAISDVVGLEAELSGKLTVGGAIAASQLATGSIPDARIPASNVTQHVGEIVHNSLSGLTTGDPHTQYIKADGSRALTGALAGVPPTADAHLATRGYVLGLLSGSSLDPVLDKDLTAPPVSPASGGRYIVAGGGGTATGAWATHELEIAEWNGSSWDFTAAADNDRILVSDEGANGVIYRFFSDTWVNDSPSTDHTTLTNIGTNTHAQIDAHLADVTKHFVINDSSTLTTEAWSANKLTSSFANKAALSHEHDASGVTSGVFSAARLGGGTPTSGSVLKGNAAWGNVDWSELTGKPTTFTPASHNHSTSEVSGLDAALAGKAPASHNHDAAVIVSGVLSPARLGAGSPSGTNFLRGDGSFAQVAYSQLTGVPAAFTPAWHNHSTSEVSGLDAALASKANTSHTQAISTITGLQADLDTRALLTQVRELYLGEHASDAAAATAFPSAQVAQIYIRTADRTIRQVTAVGPLTFGPLTAEGAGGGSTEEAQAAAAVAVAHAALAQAAAGSIATRLALSSDLVNTTNSFAGSALTFTPAANSVYEFEASLMVRTGQTASLPRVGVLWPTGDVEGVCEIATVVSASGGVSYVFGRHGDGTTLSTTGTSPAADVSHWAKVKGKIVTGAAPSGALTIGIQSENNTQTSTLRANSSLEYKKVA